MSRSTAGSFANDLFVVMSNRAVGQVLLLVSTLYCARYFAPADFGLVGLFSASIAVLSQLTSGRAEAVALAVRRPAAARHFIMLAYLANLTFLGVASSAAIMVILSGVAGPHWYLVAALPLAVVLMSVNQYVLPAQMTLLNAKRTAGRQVGVASAMTAVLQLASALFWPTAAALVLARTAGPATGTASVGRFVHQGLSDVWFNGRRVSRRFLRPVWREFIYSAPASILTVVGFQLPVFYLSWLGATDQVAFYWLGFNLLLVPYLVFSSSFRPLFLRLVVTRLNTPGLPRFMARSSLIAFVGGCTISILLAAASWELVLRFLPTEWAEARYYTSALALMLIGLITTMPINAAVSALRIQRANLIFNVTQTIVRAVVLMAGNWIGLNLTEVVLAFSAVSAVTSFAYVILMTSRLRS
jgi:O-antigen/teichoic acid export membrane protein